MTAKQLTSVWEDYGTSAAPIFSNRIIHDDTIITGETLEEGQIIKIVGVPFLVAELFGTNRRGVTFARLEAYRHAEVTQ